MTLSLFDGSAYRSSLASSAYRHPLPLAVLVTLAMTATLLGAWGFQYAGYVPCELCLRQREAYYLAIPLGALAALALAVGAPGCVWRGLLAAVALAMVSTALLGAYHAGAEWGFWPGPDSCGAAANALPTSAGDLLQSLSNTVPPSCTEAAGRFLGLSFAGWNVIAATLLAFAAAVAATTDTLQSRASATN